MAERQRVSVVRAAFVALCVCTAFVVVGPSPAPAQTVPAPGGVIASADPVPGEYIVTLRDPGVASVDDRADALTDAHGGTVLAVYDAALTGYAVATSRAGAEALAADPAVASVEQNGYVHASTTQSPTPSWGLDRIDQPALPLDSSYTYDTAAPTVHAYVIDTGINTGLADFGGRATLGIDTVGLGAPVLGSGTDCAGHGTHVAGTIGGTAYGVAKAVQLVSVRVLNCNGQGTIADVIEGVDWVTANAVKPAVVNMSLDGSLNTALDNAVTASINSGITYVIAAGNDGVDACTQSPADVAAALTVGATGPTDFRASFSNFGSCLDLFAPGESITSDWYTNPFTRTISGTSMAAPHVAGVAAQYLQRNPVATPTQVADAVVGNATNGVVSNEGIGSPDKLLSRSFVAAGVPDPPILTAEWIATGVQLTWTTPESGGSPLTKFTVSRGTSDDSKTNLVDNLGPASTAYVDETAVAGTAYSYSITATSALGTSLASNNARVGDFTGTYKPLAPSRILDTRDGTGGPASPVGSSPRTLQVTGRGGVPVSGVSAVVMNVTVTNPTMAGYATVYPANVPTPSTSNLNFVPNQTVPNLVTVKLDTAGQVKLVVGGGGTANLVADVAGYYNDGTDPMADGSRYRAASPVRILDSRTGLGGYSSPWGPGTTRDLTLTGVPADATAVVLNVTSTESNADGFATLWPSGTSKPNASNLNFVPGQTRPNLVIVAIGANDKVSLYNHLGSTNYIADLAGWYGGSQATSRFTPVTPTRVLDSRAASQVGPFPNPWGPGTTRNLTVASGAPVPSDASAVVVNVTATNATASGFVTVWPANVGTPPVVSNLNLVAGQSIPNLATVTLGNQALSFFNQQGSTDLIADVVGYFRG